MTIPQHSLTSRWCWGSWSPPLRWCQTRVSCVGLAEVTCRAHSMASVLGPAPEQASFFSVVALNTSLNFCANDTTPLPVTENQGFVASCQFLSSMFLFFRKTKPKPHTQWPPQNNLWTIFINYLHSHCRIVGEKWILNDQVWWKWKDSAGLSGCLVVFHAFGCLFAFLSRISMDQHRKNLCDFLINM